MTTATATATATANLSFHLNLPVQRPAPALAVTVARLLPQPRSGNTTRWHEAIVEHLHSRSEYALVRTIADAAGVLTAAESLVTCWIPCLKGLEEARRCQRPFSCASAVAHFIAISARLALTNSPVRANAPWLVGMSMMDQSAAHLIALLLVRRGVSARPWWAPDMPRRGTYLMVSTFDDDTLDCGDSRCLGALSLDHETRFALDRP